MNGQALLFCHHFAAEAAQALCAPGDDPVKVFPFKARCYHEKMTGKEIDRVVGQVPAEFDRVDVFCGGCCLNPDERTDPSGRLRFHVPMLCAYLVAPRALVDHLVESRAHTVTSGWLRTWRKEMKAWGMNRSTAREFFRETADRLVLLDTGAVDGTAERFAEFTKYLDLPGEVIPVGLDKLRAKLDKVLSDARIETMEGRIESLHRDLADHVMAMDVLSNVAVVSPGTAAVEARIRELFEMLFAPKRISYLKFDDGVPAEGTDVEDADGFQARFEGMDGDVGPTPEGDGILFRLKHDGRILALVALDRVAYPQYLDRYLNLAASMTSVMALADYNEGVVESLNQALRTVETTREELERSNKELQQFAYVASHDLQEPLRTITGFADLVLRRAGPDLDESIQRYLGIVREGADRMKHLIDDLLQYSRIASQPSRNTSVDLDRVVDEVVDSLAGIIGETGATISREPMPKVRGNRSHFFRLYVNLVQNAVKYRSDRPPCISLGCSKNGDGWLFSVRDNGIGIDREGLDRVFTMFHRIERSREGTGIGLAVCRRIVDQRGGRIWAESEPGKGSVFFFTIPE